MKTKLTTLLCLLVMCLFVVASLVACPANGTDGKSAYQIWLDQGNTGTVQDFVNSLRGEAGAAGKGIANVERNEAGELVLTYTDGSTENLGKVVFEDPSVKCNHEFKKYELVKASCVAEGNILNVCTKDCGYAYITYTEKNPENHAELVVASKAATCQEEGVAEHAACEACHWEDTYETIAKVPHDYSNAIVTAPTCEKDGCITYTCQFCGDVDVEVASAANNLFATGHDTIENGRPVIVVDEGANICIDGGQLLTVCGKCFDVCTNCTGKVLKAETVAPTGHVVAADWTVTTTPTLAAAGELSGYCTKCETNASVVLPQLNTADKYTKSTVEPATCTKTGIDKYTITIGAWTGSFEVVTSTKHTFNGVEMDLDKVYKLSDIDGLTLFGNAPATCLDAGKASFNCDDCGEAYLITVMGECEYDEDDLVAEKSKDATCAADGVKVYKCPTCEKETSVTLPKLPHVYTGELKATAPDADGNIKITIKCANYATCENVFSVTCAAGSWTKVEEPASCDKAGKITYTYTYTDPNGVPQQGTLEVPLAQLDHYYDNGVDQIEIDDSDDKTYTYEELKDIFGDDLTGLITFGNVFANCQEGGKFAYVCSGCGTQFLFNATGDHEWLEETTKTPADCENPGKITYTCKHNAEHTDVKVDPAAPVALGHKYKLDEANSDVKNLKFVFVCERDATHVENIEAESSREVTVPADCSHSGSKTLYYTYIDPTTGLETEEKYVVLETYDPTGLHTYGDYHEIDLDKKYTVADLKEIFGADFETAVNFFGNYPTNCQKDVPASFYCEVCEETLLINHVRGDHKWSDWAYTDATCVTDGYKERSCEIEGCDGYDKETTDLATGHGFLTNLEVEPTATEDGKLIVTCGNSDCDFHEEFVVPAWNSEDLNWTTISDPKCDEPGKKIAKFEAKIGDVIVYTYDAYVAEIPVVDHDQAQPPVETTWVHEGNTYTGYYCGICKKMVVTSKTPIEG